MISTHILDTSKGLPATGVVVQLERLMGQEWKPVSTEETNTDGRISFSAKIESGNYRLQFQVEKYFAANNTQAFFTTIPVNFNIKDASRKFHVPLLLNPYGYSTYRGS